MDTPLTQVLRTWHYAVATFAVYIFSLAYYRLTLHPLARFPGPKLAAVTRLYEAYYDVVQNGQYTFKIAEMHKKYGPIIRISPCELHINDPAFFEELYRQNAHYDKYNWAVKAFGFSGASIFTAAHDAHRTRRLPLAPYFSKAKVATRRELIRNHLDRLCYRLSDYAKTGTSFNLGAATTALVRDITTDFVLGKSYNSLDCEDFDVAMVTAGQGGGQIWRLSKHVPGVMTALQAIPTSLAMKIASDDMKTFFRHAQTTRRDMEALMTTSASSTPATNGEGPRTIVHEIMDSKLPVSEKRPDRVFEELNTILGGGFETTANVLRIIFFYVFSNATLLGRLRAELASVANDAFTAPPDLKRLEQLPLLTSILMEGLRMSPALGTRMARVAPRAGLVYDRWQIPAGTPVGMSILLMHTDEAAFPDHRRFDPDRWVDPVAKKKAERSFAPFSKGTRNCLGMNLAWAEMYMIVAGLVQSFDFRFLSASADDFVCKSDQFGIGTSGKGVLEAVASFHET